MYELKKNGKVFTSKSVGTGPSSYEKSIYRAAASQRLRNTSEPHPTRRVPQDVTICRFVGLHEICGAQSGIDRFFPVGRYHSTNVLYWSSSTQKDEDWEPSGCIGSPSRVI